jgi:putative transcriptional regulator
MRKKKSLILEVVHETAKDLYEAGVMDLMTMREFDRLCLPKIEPLEPIQIKQIRESNNVSQSVSAAILNTSLSTVQNGKSDKKDPLALHLNYFT